MASFFTCRVGPGALMWPNGLDASNRHLLSEIGSDISTEPMSSVTVPLLSTSGSNSDLPTEQQPAVPIAYPQFRYSETPKASSADALASARAEAKLSERSLQGRESQGLRLLDANTSGEVVSRHTCYEACSPKVGSTKFQLFVKPNGKYNIDRLWGFSDQFRDLWMRDRFHFLLSVNMRVLLPLMFFSYVIWAMFLAIVLAFVAEFDVERCLGGAVSHPINFYYFTVETMFAIGFGTPRFPSCVQVDSMVTIIVVSTTLFNSFILGIIFAKFSSATRRRWAVSFSSDIVGTAAKTLVKQPSTVSPIQDDASELFATTGSFDWKFKNPTTTTSVRTEDIIRSQLSHGLMGHTEFNPDIPPLKRLGTVTRHAYGSDGAFGQSGLVVNTAGPLGLRPLAGRFGRLVGNAWENQIKHVPSFLQDLEQTTDRSESNTRAVDLTNSSGRNSERNSEMIADKLDEDAVQFTLSFRIMNLTNQSFFKTHLSLFLLTHGDSQIEITRINTFYTDVPMELIELPTTVTIDSHDLISSRDLTDQMMSANFELLALLTFTDNRTSRTIEIRNSWKLDNIKWNSRFVDILSRSSQGIYQIDVDKFDHIEPDVK